MLSLSSSLFSLLSCCCPLIVVTIIVTIYITLIMTIIVILIIFTVVLVLIITSLSVYSDLWQLVRGSKESSFWHLSKACTLVVNIQTSLLVEIFTLSSTANLICTLIIIMVTTMYVHVFSKKCHPWDLTMLDFLQREKMLWRFAFL